MSIRISILDPVHIFRQGLKSILEANGSVEVTEEASNTDEFLLALEHETADLGIVNACSECGVNSSYLLRKIQRRGARIPLILYMNVDNSQLLDQVALHGIEGILSCSDDASEFQKAVVEISENRPYRSSAVERNFNSNKSSHRLYATLTGTERQVFQLLATKKTSREIASEMVISHRTVQKHRDNINRKLHLQGSNALLAYAVKFAQYSENGPNITARK